MGALLVASDIAGTRRVAAITALATAVAVSLALAGAVGDGRTRTTAIFGGLGFTLGVAIPGVLSYGILLVPAIVAWTIAAAASERHGLSAPSRFVPALGGMLGGLFAVLAVIAVLPR
jgi:hypothetical protein